MPDLQRTGALVTEHPPLGEKVAVFVASLPEQARDARIADLAYRTRERIRDGAQDYTLAGGTERHEFATPTEEAAKHPILAGVAIPAEGLVVPSWLYHVEPLPADCTVLLWGEAIDSERKDAPQRQPILWVRERPPVVFPMSSVIPNPQRMAYTSLGHPGDFAHADVRLIAAQMIAWAAHRSDMLDDAERAAIRATAFDAPPSR
jgi:hypothetical protein